MKKILILLICSFVPGVIFAQGDILITATDNLNGFTQTIRTVFPQSATQVCVVHQIRNSCRYVVWKDKREFSHDMKDIYAAPTRQAAQAGLQALEAKWGSKYGYAIKSWKDNLEELTVFFDFQQVAGSGLQPAKQWPFRQLDAQPREFYCIRPQL